MKKILVVEDDLQIQELIKEFLKAQNYLVDTADDGVLGYEKVKNNEYDLIIMDVMMPNMDGYSLCKMIRAISKTPIIFLTALSEEQDEIKGFELECDDFITKPFSFNILIKRVNAVLRRSETLSSDNEDSNELVFETLKLDKDSYKVYVDEEECEFTLKEFNILKNLIEFYPRVITREQLMDKVWGYEYYGEMRVIDAHIKNIRKKISKNYIKTVKGVGYVLEKVME
ncbi:response regulator transcription factor [Clostridium mediterraneense]|uniref:response regulator transcription factor n=1 Tax=Clostridium mediterraneense TaxID=1805472 RepID=UPI0008341A88|nr:response regulator transcription factor [Clostridium mediterraneense]